MTIIIDKNDRGSRAPVAQTAHFGKKSRNFGSQTRPCRHSCRSHGWSRHSRIVGKKTAPGFDLCDTRNDKADCVREIRGFNDFHKNQLSVRFVRRRAKSMHSFFSPTRSLNVIPSDISKYANLVGALLARTFFLLGIDMWKSQFQHLGWRNLQLAAKYM